MAKKHAILLNQLYAGSFLAEGINIGHEAINLIPCFRGADGATGSSRHYLYITPNGKVADGRYDIESVVFVRHISGGKTYEVVAVAKDLDLRQKEKGLGERIQYGDEEQHAFLSELLSANVWHGKADGLEIIITFEAGELKKPPQDTPIFLSLEERPPGIEGLSWRTLHPLGKKEKSRLIPQGMRRYITLEDDEDAYGMMKALVEESGEWDDFEERLDFSSLQDDEYPTFLEIAGKEDDEIAYSNLLAYYLKYREEGFQAFCKEVLKIDDFDEKPEIKRERSISLEIENAAEGDGRKRGLIDLWIEGEHGLIVIENKIKSGLSGDDQMERYRRAAERGKKTLYCYLLVPNGHPLGWKQYPDGIKVIAYKEVHDFFDRNKKLYRDEPHFDDFLRSLERQSLPAAEMSYRVMRRRFMRRIKAVCDSMRQQQ